MQREAILSRPRGSAPRQQTFAAGRVTSVTRRQPRMHGTAPVCRRQPRRQGARRERLGVCLLLMAALPILAVVTLGCGSSKKNTTKAPTATGARIAAPAATTQALTTVTASPVPPATNTPAPTAAASAQASSGGGLSGKWSGQYGGTYQGTFTLTWQQSASNLSGSITLSAPAATLAITGTVEGGNIRFGTVGGAISYSGSVSGDSMSGTYQTVGGNGTWSASRSP